MFAKAKLTPKGDVQIDINDGDRVLTTQPGGSLLAALGNQKIFLPSACGGKGSCGMCKCQVLSGAGSILPTETGFFSYKQQHDNWRLACQVKVKENIKMKIPESVLGIKKWECTVVSNRNISTFLKEFVVKLPEGENLKFKSGGYIQIDVPALDVDFRTMDIDEKYKADWEKMKMFDLKMHNPEPTYRAYSMANSPAEGNIIMLNIVRPRYRRIHAGESGNLLVFHLLPQTGRQSDDFRTLRRVLPARNEQRNDVYRRWCRYGADALPHFQPVPHDAYKTESQLLVWRPCPPGSSLCG